MSSLKVVFFGTPKFAADILAFMIDNGISIIGIVTKPDDFVNKHGRPSQVKQLAEKYLHKVPIFQPQKATDPHFIQEMKDLKPDLFVVVAYGKILRLQLLFVPVHGCINVHASLLPKYRGAAPIQRAIMHGEKETGITIIEMAPEMDAGRILDTAKTVIGENMTSGELLEELAKIAGPLLVDVIKQIKENRTHPVVQDESRVSSAPKISPQECMIDWNFDAQQVHNQIRALSPFPGAKCQIKLKDEIKTLKIFRTDIIYQTKSPKEISIENDALIIFCKTNALKVLEVQLEGKRKMTATDFLKGLHHEIIII